MDVYNLQNNLIQSLPGQNSVWAHHTETGRKEFVRRVRQGWKASIARTFSAGQSSRLQPGLGLRRVASSFLASIMHRLCQTAAQCTSSSRHGSPRDDSRVLDGVSHTTTSGSLDKCDQIVPCFTAVHERDCGVACVSLQCKKNTGLNTTLIHNRARNGIRVPIARINEE